MGNNEDFEEGEIIGNDDLNKEEDDAETSCSLLVEEPALETAEVNISADEMDAANCLCECEMCNNAIAKYCCPSCEVRTCSLDCCKKHKIQYACDGAVKRSRFVPLSKFDNFAMLSDIRFLEEAGRLRRTCRAEYEMHKINRMQRDRRKLNLLTRECSKRGCKLLFLPGYFEKSQINSSNYDHIAETIFWKIKWIFVDAADSLTIDTERNPETVKIITLLKQIVQPKRNSDYVAFSETLVQYRTADLNQLKCFINVENNGWTKDKRYYELCLQLDMRENLRQKILVEFPVIYVCLPNACHNNNSSFKTLTDDDKNEIVRKRIWERNPVPNRTLKENFKLLEESAKISTSTQRSTKKSFLSHEKRGVAAGGDVLTENAAENSDKPGTGLKPLKRLIRIPYNKNPKRNGPQQGRNNENRENRHKNSSKHQFSADKDFRLQKRDMIKRIAEELTAATAASKQSELSGNENQHDLPLNWLVQNRNTTTSSDKAQNNINDSVVDVSVVDEKRSGVVKTQFFGTLCGPNRLCPYSDDSESGETD